MIQKKVVLILLMFLPVIFIVHYIHAQELNPHDFTKVADVLPPPPNAAALGKYGGIEVSLNTGGVNKTVEVYTFKSTNITVPISLAYSSSGFKVADVVSRAGYGWVLNAGGVINRTVVGEADEFISRKVPPSSIGVDSISYDFLHKSAEGNYWDTEPDVFSFNFNGYSGKFVFDENDQPVFMPVSNLKIEKNLLSTAEWNFKVTTPDGLIFYFGGTTATEKSKKTSNCGKAFSAFIPAAWYLKKIVSPLSDSVTFTYESTGTYNYSGAANQILYADGILNDISVCSNPSGNQQCPDYASQSRICIGAFSAQGVYLKEISSPKSGKIEFEYSSMPGSGDKLHKKIIVKDFNNSIKYIFELKHKNVLGSLFGNDYSGYITRPFLEEIIEKPVFGDLSHKSHRFYYHKADSLPQEHSFAQDRWGYFNGKNNLNLAEDPDDFYYRSVYPAATADRSPDPAFAMRSMLSKIIYPTGGYDTIYYEGNDFYKNHTFKPAVTNLGISVTGTGNWTQESNSTSQLPISYNHSAKLDYRFIYNSGQGELDSVHNKGSVSVYNLTTSQEVFYRSLLPDNEWRTELLYFSPGNTYQVTITANGAVVTTNAILYYRPGSAVNVDTNYLIGGVRVKKVKSFTHNSASPSVKTFYYAGINSLNNSSGGWQPEPQYVRTFSSRFACYVTTDPPSCQHRFCSHGAWHSDPLNSLNIYPSGVTYTKVVEGLGEDFENGAIEHTYTIANDQGPINLMSSYSGDNIAGATFFNNSFYNGKELTQTVYKKATGGQLVPVQKTENIYKIDSRKSQDVWGATVQQRYQYCNGSVSQPYEGMIDAFNAVRYAHQSRWVYIDTVKDTFYDETGAVQMTMVKVFTYDNTNHLLPAQIETKNSDGTITGVNSKYAGDYGTLTASDNITEGIKNLNNKWIITPEIEKVIYRKNSDGSIQRVLGATFTSFKTSPPLPDTIYQLEADAPLTDFTFSSNQSGAVNKDNRYKKQIIFTEYDGTGNILKQQRNNDIPLCYIWDYNASYPVAQISNTSTSDIAYTSFETGSSGNWSISGGSYNTQYKMTGKRGYNLSSGNSISKSALNTGTNYIVSYWSRNGSLTVNSGSGTAGPATRGWTYYEHSITGASTITVTASSAVIDELRLYPGGSLMNTATYDPLTGLTSQCDANNRITYYEYDGFNRLQLIRDRDSSILKQICYNYFGQVASCGSVAIWENTELTRCKPCSLSIDDYQFITDTLEVQQIDNNPGSDSYQQTRWITVGPSENCTPAYWENVYPDSIRCKQVSGNNTGEREQKQIDINFCSPTYNQNRWVVIDTNTTECPNDVQVTITYSTVAFASGFTASFTNNATQQVYNFNVPTGSGTLGTVPEGTYAITITKSGNTVGYYFGNGCQFMSGTSASWSNVNVTTTSCNEISILFEEM